MVRHYIPMCLEEKFNRSKESMAALKLRSTGNFEVIATAMLIVMDIADKHDDEMGVIQRDHANILSEIQHLHGIISKVRPLLTKKQQLLELEELQARLTALGVKLPPDPPSADEPPTNPSTP